MYVVHGDCVPIHFYFYDLESPICVNTVCRIQNVHTIGQTLLHWSNSQDPNLLFFISIGVGVEMNQTSGLWLVFFSPSRYNFFWGFVVITFIYVLTYNIELTGSVNDHSSETPLSLKIKLIIRKMCVKIWNCSMNEYIYGVPISYFSMVLL